MNRKLHNPFRRHVSDGDLLLLSTDELSFERRARAERHLAACSKCRARRNRFKEVDLLMVEYLDFRAQTDEARGPGGRYRLMAQLNRLAAEPDEVSEYGTGTQQRKRDPARVLIPMSPILGAALVLAGALIPCVFIWLQQAKPSITSNTLLVRAEAWDNTRVVHTASGVIRQTVQITTPQRTLRRTIYRDVEGKKQAKRLLGDDAQLLVRLEAAHVQWDSPLSAMTYQDWHDSQRIRQDEIRGSAGHLLTLTTTTPEGIVAGQSLTVRDTDFHPVKRTVSFRDSETVEIAELAYEVLPWTSANNSLFQPESVAVLGIPIRASGAFMPTPPAMPTEAQLDEAELGARLTLNRLHADTGEQIEVIRDGQGIEVRGITDSETRKHELETQLYMLPHVHSAISSIEGMKEKPARSGELSSVTVVEMKTKSTPLETYYLAHGRDMTSVGGLAQQLFNTAFAVDLESKAIEGLERRFSRHEGISLIASATLTDLLFTHKHRLLTALEEEKGLLNKAQIQTTGADPDEGTGASDPLMLFLAERNLALARELALGNGSSGRSAEVIAAELAATRNQLYRQAYETQVAPQNSASSDKRK